MLNPSLEPGFYRNPVIHADYSDPDVVRVGEDFFLVSSSFASAPGLPVLHSRDLVNWRIINHVVPRLGWSGSELPAHGKGVWAPSLRFHHGVFFVFFGSPDEGIFMATTTDPFGPWSELTCVKRTLGWIDPCPFWDDDGQAYLVNAFAQSRIGFKSVLRVSRMKPDGTEIEAEGRFVFDGQDNHVTLEGPKLYKRQGWYYIFAPAGGVKHGWQTVLRSRSIFGPYEDRVVLHQGNSPINGPHQGAWVETARGESWFLHFQDKGAFGRVVHLQPMTWRFDWPVIGVDTNNDGVGEPVLIFRRPQVSDPGPPQSPQTSDDFQTATLGLQWQWQADPQDGWFTLLPQAGRLRLVGQPLPSGPRPTLLDCPHVLGQKFPASRFRVDTAVTLAGPVGSLAGLVVLGEDFASVALRRTKAGFQVVFVQGTGRWDSRAQALVDRKTQDETGVAEAGPGVALRLEVTEGLCQFFWGEGLQPAGPRFEARPGLWVGAKFGLYALAPGVAEFGPVEVSVWDEDDHGPR